MDLRRSTRLYAVGDTKFVELTGDFLETRAPRSGRDADRYDVAVLPLSDAQIADLGRSRYLGPEDLAPGEPVDVTPVFGSRYLLLGYPASKQPKRIEAELVPVPQRLPGFPRALVEYDARGLEPRHHILFEYKRDEVFNSRGRLTGPKPQGMSGGGAWSVDLYGARRLPHPRLVSILTEYHEAPHHTITSTRVGLCIDAISDHFPALRPLLPKPSH
jgi:hypothetical protein